MFFLTKLCKEDWVAKRERSPASSLGAEAPTPPGPWHTWHFFWKRAAAAALVPVGLPLAVVVPVVLGEGGGAFFLDSWPLDDPDEVDDFPPDFEPDFLLEDDEPDLSPDLEEPDLEDEDLLADCCDELLPPEAEPDLLEPQPAEKTMPKPRTSVTNSAFQRML